MPSTIRRKPTTRSRTTTTRQRKVGRTSGRREALTADRPAHGPGKRPGGTAPQRTATMREQSRATSKVRNQASRSEKPSRVGEGVTKKRTTRAKKPGTLLAESRVATAKKLAAAHPTKARPRLPARGSAAPVELPPARASSRPGRRQRVTRDFLEADQEVSEFEEEESEEGEFEDVTEE